MAAANWCGETGNPSRGLKLDFRCHQLQDLQPGTIVTQSWFNARDVDRKLANRYVSSGWFERIGAAAYRRANDHIGWPGAVYGLQQEGPARHVGGEAALVTHGYGHFVQRKPTVDVFGPPASRPPVWFVENDWGADFHYRTTSLFANSALALTTKAVGNVTLTVSSPERAILELLLDVPARHTAGYALTLMRSLSTVRPKTVQTLLESCRSVKVKRLALLLAERSEHRWVSKLRLAAVDLGSGKRVLGSGGHYYSSYQLSLPENLDAAGDAA
ncbi:MAG: type IV toxin-antitoxin system AbiEi family antitoxin domain-containing protein [Myxococcota bacterium]